MCGPRRSTGGRHNGQVSAPGDLTRRRFTTRAAAGVAVAGAVSSPLLAGCGITGRPRGSSTGPLVYWGGADPAGVAAHHGYLTGLVGEFTRTTGRPVTLRVLPWQTLFTELTRGIVAGDGPDVAEIRTGWSVTLQATGGLAEVNGEILAQLGGRKRFLDAPWHTAGAGGRPASSIPVRSSVRVLLYDRAVLAAAQLPGPPDTWAQLAYVAPVLARRVPHVLAWAGADLDALVADLTLLTRQAGGELLAGENPHFVDPPVPWALDLRLGLATAVYADPADAAVGDATAPARAVVAGRAAAALVESTALGMVRAAPPGRRARLVVAPTPTRGHDPDAPHGLLLRSLTGGTNLVVPRASARAAAAWQLVAHLTDDVRQSRLDPDTGTLPVVSRAWTARTSPTARMLFGILTLGSLPTPATVHQPELRATLGGMVHDLLAAGPGTIPSPARQLAALKATQLTFDALP